jgi:chromosome segregation protein
MRLRKIKLSGFKSFVDPTTLIVPGNLVGIVGPNGCGKSNIIDAVTWVMGESSAKHLRGESLTDVIFNGSSARQPVGQAMVELVFDNSEGRVGGQYASYSELAIKRQINREGVSSYFLNGTRCRRKDIHGIFLGTGLGPRGYSIIEQGMISRLIEAKPDELRVFIEEAAGISKYREKRRETENRMRHTKENLDRLQDIREELGKQLNHLQRQAKAAERYQLLKNEERQLKAELLALNYRDLKAEVAQRDEKARTQETRVEECIALLRRIEAEIEKKREELVSSNEAFNQVQSGYYQIGADISQLEQKIEYSKERITALEADIIKVQQLIKTTEEQHRLDQQKLIELDARVKELEPKLNDYRSDSNKAYDTLNQAEQAMQKWQDEWDAFKETEAGFRQQIEVGNSRLTYLGENLEQTVYRRQLLRDELESAEMEGMDRQIVDLEATVSSRVEQVTANRSMLDEKIANVRHYRDQVHTLTEKIAGMRTQQQKLEGTLAALIPLQQGDTSLNQAGINSWLTTLGEQDSPRLLEKLNIEPAWAQALESVLDQNLQSVIVNNFDAALAALANWGQGNISLITAAAAPAGANVRHLPRLIDKVVSGTSIDKLLARVYLAETIAEAMQIYPQLDQNESVVTRSGIWIGPGWIRVHQTKSEDSILLREQKIQALKAENAEVLSVIADLQQQLAQARSDLESAEQQQQDLQTGLGQAQNQQTLAQAQLAEIKVRREQLARRIEQITEELEKLESREDASRQESDNLRQMLERTRTDQENLASQKTTLIELREKHAGLLEQARTNWQSTHEHSHEIALQLESLSSQKASLEQAIRRNEIQLGNMTANLADLQKALELVHEPMADLQKKLEEALQVRIETEKQLSKARETVQTIDMQIREKEQERIGAEQAVDENRVVLEKLKLDSQEVKVRLQTVNELLQEGEHQPDQILETIDAAANKQEWQERIASTEQKIQRLGPINLAAIDEYTQLGERKEYLDRQNNDLTEALATLESAIKKIDKETRTRFQETFDRLNANLKEMFPIMFGGGMAYLEMTGNDLLETGVTIVARPPGKKNSSIHLLSGGEKALTAVALVFSIFKLNPAPFCILDEVDAPLDDTNAGRFSSLLAQMSADVQFLFITHNKITMEIANQLLGVTMHEPGVSRLVTVDIEEAVKMATSA